jgi:hypothetical protein
MAETQSRERYHGRTATNVRDGEVQKKNRHANFTPLAS